MLFIWSVFGFMSTLQFVVHAGRWFLALLPPVIPWLSTTSGRVLLFVAGLSWLSAVVLFNPKDTERDSSLDSNGLRILEFLCSKQEGGRAEDAAKALSIPLQRVLYHLDRLEQSHNADRFSLYPLNPMSLEYGFKITAKGRETLVKRGLL